MDAMLHLIRLGHIRRCITEVRDLVGVLIGLSMANAVRDAAVMQGVFCGVCFAACFSFVAL